MNGNTEVATFLINKGANLDHIDWVSIKNLLCYILVITVSMWPASTLWSHLLDCIWLHIDGYLFFSMNVQNISFILLSSYVLATCKDLFNYFKSTIYRDLLATDKIWWIGKFRKTVKLNSIQNLHVVATPTCPQF